MAIDKTGEFWKGSDFSDIVTYLTELQPGGYDVTSVHQSKCGCGNTAFTLRVDFDNEFAKRICAACKQEAFIADSEDGWDEASSETLCCECNSFIYEMGISFSMKATVGFNSDPPWVRWMAIGVRCTKCGTLGSPIDWKADYEFDDPITQRI